VPWPSFGNSDFGPLSDFGLRSSKLNSRTAFIRIVTRQSAVLGIDRATESPFPLADFVKTREPLLQSIMYEGNV
jgi:hypothetical protein